MKHHPHAVLVDEPLQQFQDLRLRRHVERRGRLVGDQQLRPERNRHGDHHALALPAGQFVRIAVEREALRRQPDAVERLAGDRQRLARGWPAMHQHGLGHLVADGLAPG